MVSEDSGCASSVHSPVATASVHGERSVHQCGETLVGEVLSSVHRPDDAGEGEEVSLHRAQEGLRLEEWDDPRQQVFPPTNDVHQCGVGARSVIRSDPSAAQPLADEVEDLTPFGVLADMELRNQLPTGPGTAVPTDRYVERTFSIDETRDVRIQPFLLIVRTGWIFTAHASTLRRG